MFISDVTLNLMSDICWGQMLYKQIIGVPTLVCHFGLGIALDSIVELAGSYICNFACYYTE